jgi:4-diphosphocytidyl-2-C-methyl-D-erythritol kinase
MDMIVFPISKINIGLRITEKREDGFHNIETVFYPVRLSDALEFVVNENSDKDILTVSGIDIGGDTENNLLMKTLSKLRTDHTFPYLRVHLHKAIPIGAGLGGGSSDAACLLKAVSKHFDLNISKNDLDSMALEIGSDCPFFLDGIPSFATGRGELFIHLTPFLSAYYLVLLNPGVGINTAEAFKNCKPQIPDESLDSLYLLPVKDWENRILNDFEEYAFKIHPIIGEIKTELYNSGAVFSLMSGSGSSVYGLFSNKPTLPEKLRKLVIWEGVM